jgi:hypothetical protein
MPQSNGNKQWPALSTLSPFSSFPVTKSSTTNFATMCVYICRLHGRQALNIPSFFMVKVKCSAFLLKVKCSA